MNPNPQHILPDYWLRRPQAALTAHTRRAFDRLLHTLLAENANPVIQYTLKAPKWQFLCYAAEQHTIALHGSGNGEIAVFEPRQPVDLTAFGNQKAVYAAADGIWAMFFAIVDRERFAMWVNNACIQLVDTGGQASQPFYVFSISRPALSQQPWRNGTVYLLPRDSFDPQPPMPFGSFEVRIAQLASLEPVSPIARLEVTPQDFPFLHQIRGHDDDRLQEYAQAMQTGSPWPDDI